MTVYFLGNCEPRQFSIFDEKVFTNGRYMTVKVVQELANNTTEVTIKGYNIPKHIASYVERQGYHQTFQLVLDLCFNLRLVYNSCAHSSITTQQGTVGFENKNKSFDLIDLEDIWFQTIKELKQKNKETCMIKSEETNTDDTIKDTFTFMNSVCAICSSDEEITCIIACGHSFCNNCWKGYIDAKIVDGCKMISCPGEDCAGQLEPSFVLLYLENQLIPFMRKFVENEVSLSSSVQKCPNKNNACNIVAVRKENISNNDNTVVCHCKMHWCFECLDFAHWPASCEAQRAYRHQTQADSHDENGEIVQRFVVVKLCPSCRYPIEKFGGCDHMVCMCGATFCWRCTSRFVSLNVFHLFFVDHYLFCIFKIIFGKFF